MQLITTWDFCNNLPREKVDVNFFLQFRESAPTLRSTVDEKIGKPRNNFVSKYSTTLRKNGKLYELVSAGQSIKKVALSYNISKRWLLVFKLAISYPNNDNTMTTRNVTIKS